MLEAHTLGPDVQSGQKRRVWPRMVALGLLGVFWLSVSTVLGLANESNEPPAAGYYVFVFGGYVGIAVLAHISMRQAGHRPRRAFLTALAINPAIYLLGIIAVVAVLR
jgi:hypothetical protein